MKDSFESITIQFLGKSFNVKCHPEEQPSLQESVDFLNKKMLDIQKKSSHANFERITVITALNLANELLQNNRQKNHLLQKINEKLSGLQNKLDEVLQPSEQTEFSYILDQ